MSIYIYNDSEHDDEQCLFSKKVLFLKNYDDNNNKIKDKHFLNTTIYTNNKSVTIFCEKNMMDNNYKNYSCDCEILCDEKFIQMEYCYYDNFQWIHQHKMNGDALNDMHIYCTNHEITKITLIFTAYIKYKYSICEEEISFVKTKYGYKLNFNKNTFITFIESQKILNIYSSNNSPIYI